MIKLESDVKRLKCDLQLSRNRCCTVQLSPLHLHPHLHHNNHNDNSAPPIPIRLNSFPPAHPYRENELRDQIVCYMSSERSLKSEISSLLVEKSGLESRINSLISTR